MKRIIYLSLVALSLTFTSCTAIVKGLAKLVVKDYNDHTDVNLSKLQLKDSNGHTQSLGETFRGKTVYLYVWKDDNSPPPSEKNKEYKALKARFAKYGDVVFANLYVGSESKPGSYNLVENDFSSQIASVLTVQSAAPFIIGKDGSILVYRGPKPGDKVLVDYVLYNAKHGIDGTRSAKKLIRGVNGKQQFKTQELREWYTNHFGKAPDESLSFGVSTTN